MTLRFASLDRVRGAIAECCLGGTSERCEPGTLESEGQLGRIILRPHQLDAVRQIRPLLGELRGALLADAVGLGKTFTALALAREASRTTVICPAGLCEMWERAARDVGVVVATVSMEALSRRAESRNPSGGASRNAPGPSVPPSPLAHTGRPVRSSGPGELLIVDEAHHFRNPHTRRYHALAALAINTPLLLLTATPVHSRIEDLLALLALFLGSRAWTLSETERSRCIVRRTHIAPESIGPSSLPGAPTVGAPRVLRVGDDASTLDAILSLPPPVPPRDGGACGALMALGLVRQWASSAGALRAALRRRLERASALESALSQGSYPSHRELRMWCLGDGAIQLALPDLLVPRSWESAMADVADAVRTHATAVRALSRRLAAIPDVDGERATQLRAVAHAHPGVRVVAFAAYEETVGALYRHLRADGHVCALSARGGFVAGGRISRREILNQFEPGSPCAVAHARRIDLLLATDLLSEGISLARAGVVVHLDLPWTPARLEQRVGRLARLGSPHTHVDVYALAPPVASEVLLDVERRLRAKLDTAARAVGIAGSIVPAIAGAFAGTADDPATPATHAAGRRARQSDDRTAGIVAMTGDLAAGPGSRVTGSMSPPEYAATIRSVVGRWRIPSVEPEQAGPVYGVVQSPVPGFLAACRMAERPLLIAAAGGPATDAPATVATAVGLADGGRSSPDVTASAAAVRAIAQWWSDHRASSDAGLSTMVGARVRLRVLARIARIMRRAPPHLRARTLALGDRAREAMTATCGVGGEWILGQLVDASLPDIPWLRTLAAFGDAYGIERRGSGPGRALTAHDLEVVAIIAFEPPAAPADT